MIVEITAGFGVIAASGLYQFYRKISKPDEPEPEPEIAVNLSLFEEFQKAISDFEYWPLLTNWISVGFYITAAVVAIWSGVVQPIRSRKKRARAEMQLTDLIRNDSDTESCVGNLSDEMEEPHYTSERECGLDDDQFCDPGIPNMDVLPKHQDEKVNNQRFLDSVLNPEANSIVGQQESNIPKVPKIDVQEVGKSFAIMESEGNPSEKPPASFLSEISDRDKARVEKILKTNTELTGPNSFPDDESNFCTNSLSSTAANPHTPFSNRNSFRNTPTGHQIHQLSNNPDSKQEPESDNHVDLLTGQPNVPPGVVVLKSSSYGDVSRGGSEEKCLDPNLLTPDTNPKIAKEDTTATTTTTTTTNSSISSSRSRRSSSRVDKPPSGNITVTPGRMQGSKIPVSKRVSSSQKPSAQISSQSEEVAKNSSRSKSDNSNSIDTKILSPKNEQIGNSSSRFLDSRTSSQQEGTVQKVIGDNSRLSGQSAGQGVGAYELSCSEESEVSVQSLLDQSEFSLLTSSPEAKMPEEYQQADFKNRRQVAKCMSGKTIDDKFNNLLDVVMRNCDQIHALYRASSRERISGADREGEVIRGGGAGVVPGRRSSSQSRSRRSNIPLATAAGVRNNRAKSCPRVRNVNDSQGSRTSVIPNSLNNDNKSTVSSRSYMNNNYFSFGGSYLGNSSFSRNFRGPTPRLKNPPMRFGHEDKTVFIAAGHYRPSDLEVIRQRSNLRHVGMNLTK